MLSIATALRIFYAASLLFYWFEFRSNAGRAGCRNNPA